MNVKNRKRRGFTLAELTVVLAVLAIVSTMVVSFTAMVSSSRELSSARLDALGDVRVAESLIEGFIESNSGVGVAEDKKSLSAGEQTLYFEKTEGEQGGRLVTPDTSVTLERVTEITFDAHGEGDVIYYCTVVYEVGEHRYSYTFCVNPYVGESIQESIQEGTNE